MNKAQIITILQQAKPDHIEWVKQAHKIISDAPKDEISKPIACNDCLFGKWQKKEGYKLVNIPQIKELEALHKEVHDLYTVLYYTTFDRRKTPRAMVISKGIEIPIKERKFRVKKLKLLEKKTVTLVRSLAFIEKKVESMSNSDFLSPWLS